MSDTLPRLATTRPATARRRRPSLVTLAAVALLALFLLAAVLAPVLAPHDPVGTDLAAIYAHPSSTNPLGADSNGRDLLSRLLYGARTALLGPLLVTTFSLLLGAILAGAAAWRGGWLDAAVSRAFDLLFAFPGLLLAILAAATFGKGLTAAAAALALSYTPYAGRIIRGSAIQQVSLPYVTALKATGFGGFRIVSRHLLPNLRGLVISQGAVLFGYAMIDLAAVSFLGLGVQQPTPDWGAMVAGGLPGILAGHPQEALLAGACICLTVVAVNLLGERLGESEAHR